MASEQLNYCPFCGSAEITLVTPSAVHIGPESYYDCPNCGTVGSLGFSRERSSTREDASVSGSDSDSQSRN